MNIKLCRYRSLNIYVSISSIVHSARNSMRSVKTVPVFVFLISIYDFDLQEKGNGPAMSFETEAVVSVNALLFSE